METIECLKVKNGIIVVTIPPTDNGIGTGRPKDDTTLILGPHGLILIYKDHQIPIPEEMFDYVLENRIISIYELNATEHLHSPTVTFELERDKLIEGTTIYRYEKKRVEEIGQPATL